MENLPTDLIQKYVYDQLHPHRRNMPTAAFNAMTANITFLVKHSAGPDIQPRAVVVSVIYLHESIGFNIANTRRMEHIAISVHEGPRQSKIIVQVEVGTNSSSSNNVIHALEREVNKSVKDIQDNKAGG